MPPDRRDGPPERAVTITALPTPITRTKSRVTHQFTPASTYSLSPATLAHHVRQLRRESWQEWELRVRFGRWAA